MNEKLKVTLQQIVREQLAHELPHTCFTCKYFTFKTREGQGNRGCRYPGKIVTKGGMCQMWKLQTDPRKRKPSFTSYYPEGK